MNVNGFKMNKLRELTRNSNLRVATVALIVGGSVFGIYAGMYAIELKANRNSSSSQNEKRILGSFPGYQSTTMQE